VGCRRATYDWRAAVVDGNHGGRCNRPDHGGPDGPKITALFDFDGALIGRRGGIDLATSLFGRLGGAVSNIGTVVGAFGPIVVNVMSRAVRRSPPFVGGGQNDWCTAVLLCQPEFRIEGPMAVEAIRALRQRNAYGFRTVTAANDLSVAAIARKSELFVPRQQFSSRMDVSYTAPMEFATDSGKFIARISMALVRAIRPG
jgi:hypothetical protein